MPSRQRIQPCIGERALPSPAFEGELLEKWYKIRNYRAEVMRALEELRIALRHLQNFDPTGVGAVSSHPRTRGRAHVTAPTMGQPEG